jgi:hypothetical protein
MVREWVGATDEPAKLDSVDVGEKGQPLTAPAP